jgi:hypothetical protein
MSPEAHLAANTCPVAAELQELIPVQAAANQRLVETNQTSHEGADLRVQEMGLRDEIASTAADIVRKCQQCDMAGVFLGGAVKADCPSSPQATELFGAAAELDNRR